KSASASTPCSDAGSAVLAVVSGTVGGVTVPKAGPWHQSGAATGDPLSRALGPDSAQVQAGAVVRRPAQGPAAPAVGTSAVSSDSRNRVARGRSYITATNLRTNS